MGVDYALVHLKYTIPPAITLTLLYRPLFTRLDVYRILFLIAIAVVATTPWDSYLIRCKIWTYPPSVIYGPVLFGIPAEEYFFFVIQTYITCLIYLFCNKTILHSAYLVGRKDASEPSPHRKVRLLGQFVLGVAIAVGAGLVWLEHHGTYLGLILVWALPFGLLLWTFSYQFLLGLPYTSTVLPIALPTVYLWIVDTLALRRGTWRIESGTKLGIHLWEGLEIEEAFFFAATNVLIVFGLVAFDNAVAVLVTFPERYPQVPAWPSPILLVKALCLNTAIYDTERIRGIREAEIRLKNKSRSFHLASSIFTGRLRVDLIILYSFCRVADDLVDNASTKKEAMTWTSKIRRFLTLSQSNGGELSTEIEAFVRSSFPITCHSALLQLPMEKLSFGPLFKLLDGFLTDQKFAKTQQKSKASSSFPITDEDALLTYGSQVAGTIAMLVLDLVFWHAKPLPRRPTLEYFKSSGGHMGIALQLINIARDIGVDATMGRVYIPGDWLEESNLTAQDVLNDPEQPCIETLRRRLLQKAFALYNDSIGAIAQLPVEGRGPMRVAIESYVEIGRVLSTEKYKVQHGRATVPKLRRIYVAWKALSRDV